MRHYTETDAHLTADLLNGEHPFPGLLYRAVTSVYGYWTVVLVDADTSMASAGFCRKTFASENLSVTD